MNLQTQNLNEKKVIKQYGCKKYMQNIISTLFHYGVYPIFLRSMNIIRKSMFYSYVTLNNHQLNDICI